MSLNGITNDAKIWNYLKSKGLNDYAISGIMGNMFAESGLSPTNMQDSFEKKLGYNDATYTAAVDNGTYKNFIKDGCGFGLTQTTFWSRKENLYNYAKSRGVSIGDLEMQLDFFWKELTEDFKSVYQSLQSVKSVKEASDLMLTKFEMPGDVSNSMKNLRASYSQKYYNAYANTNKGSGKVATIDTNKAINALIAIAKNEVGYLEKASNSNLDDKTANSGYNNYTKYWRDVMPEWNGQYWCAVFVSWCFMQAFGKETATKLLKHWPYVYCPTMADLFTLNANPKVGDIVIFYRSGEFKHTGIVIAVNGDYFETIEGNASAGSSITPNGGGVVKKSYYNSQLPGTKFCTPDYSIVTNVNSTSLSNSSSSSSSYATNTTSLLCKGSKGSSVKDLQEKLNKLGYNLVVDGEFGDKTENAVLDFQHKSNIEVDGVVGPTTLSFLNTAIGKLSTANSSSESKMPYIVQITASELNIRSNAGMQYPIVGVIKDRGCYTIVEEKDGWGLLKSKAGWICLQYTRKI